MAWATRGEIEEFQVTWEYDNFEVVGGITGLGGGRFKYLIYLGPPHGGNLH